MAFAAARPPKGTRRGVHARTLQDEELPSEESVDSPASTDGSEELPSADSEDSGDSKTGRVAGPSKRDCKMCKFHN